MFRQFKCYTSGLNKFNICVHAKLCVHKMVTLGANLHCLILNMVTDIASPIYFAIN